jgi:UDP-galactopyranose mutase
MKKCDVLIVGAGFAGMTLAERLSNELGKHCLVVEKRKHLGGNAHDYKDTAGVLVHAFGPHLFHTNSDRIVSYLSQFTEWLPVEYRAKSYTHGKFWSFPISLYTFEQMMGRPSDSEEMEAYLEERRVSIAHPSNSEEMVVSQVGWELYNKFYKNYVLKQWKRPASQLDAAVCARIPIRTTHNDLLYDDKHQMMPQQGYTAMIQHMVNPKIEILLETDYREVQVEAKHTVYTGPIDEYFGYAHGSLPYRSLRFEHETFEEELHQPAAVIAYPNSEVYTRSFEAKHITGQKCRYTTVVRDYPQDQGDQLYPIPAPDAAKAYGKYKEMAEVLPRVSFVGRLARYQYINIDQAVGMALAEFERLRKIL